MKKNYIAIVRDHSGSMWGLAQSAARDYNSNIASLKEASQRENLDTIVSTVKCGVGSAGLVERDVVNSNVQVLKEITAHGYETTGGSTPLFDSVGEAIEIIRSAPDAGDPEVSFLVMVITDGQENSSRRWRSGLGEEIKRLQATDRWTFAFRVPRGYATALEDLGIPGGNILEWDQTERGFEVATRATEQSISNYYLSRSSGLKSVKTFYTDLSAVSASQVKAELKDISGQVEIFRADREELVREFCERKTRKAFLKGAAFYELTKTEPKVQDYKQIAIRDRKTNAVYAGEAARDLLGLPRRGTARVVPGDHSAYDVFVQSTSVNRKLPAGSRLLYWPKAGVPYVEGVSAPYDRR